MFINVKARLTFKVGVYAAFCAARVFRCEDVQDCDILIPTSVITPSQSNMLDPGDIFLLGRISGGIVAHTFGPIVALDRLKRYARPAYHSLGPFSNFIHVSLELSTTSYPPLTALMFWAYPALSPHPTDIVTVDLTSIPGQHLPCCMIDIIAVNPAH